MARYFIEVAYKGTRYSGFQVQENAITIQSEVEKAFHTLHRHHIPFTGSSRTDTGVHAMQNFFHFDFDSIIHPQAVYKLNAILPRDIVVKRVIPVSTEAHSRFDATSREYNYRIHRSKNPFLEDFSFYYPYSLNLELLQEGANLVLQQKNFIAFSKTNTQVKNFNCSIYQCVWVEADDQLILIIQGNRFLRGMVRLLTATLLKLGRSKITLDEFHEFFSGNRKTAYSVPAHGLFLNKVQYPENYFPS